MNSKKELNNFLVDIETAVGTRIGTHNSRIYFAAKVADEFGKAAIQVISHINGSQSLNDFKEFLEKSCSKFDNGELLRAEIIKKASAYGSPLSVHFPVYAAIVSFPAKEKWYNEKKLNFRDFLNHQIERLRILSVQNKFGRGGGNIAIAERVAHKIADHYYYHFKKAPTTRHGKGRQEATAFDRVCDVFVAKITDHLKGKGFSSKFLIGSVSKKNVITKIKKPISFFDIDVDKEDLQKRIELLNRLANKFYDSK